MTAPAEVTVGPKAIRHLRNLVSACRAGSRDAYRGASIDWAEETIRALTPEVPVPKDLSGLDVHLREMHGAIVYRMDDYVIEHDEQHRRWPGFGVDPEMVDEGVPGYQPHTHPEAP